MTIFIDVRVNTHSGFGAGRGPIWLDDVMCTGRETRLVDCPYRQPFGSTGGCNHNHDAGVYCRGIGLLLTQVL